MSQQQRSLLPDVVGGRYAIRRELGRGGVAVVYLADDLLKGGQVALKVLRREFAASIGSERFLREIRLASQLRHELILPLLDSGQAADLPYYVMPFVEQGSLRDRLNRERPLRLETALQIATEIAEALDYAHAQGIVHRDIKPDNILFVNGRAVVADFGLARAVAEAADGPLTESGVAMGTPAYMSPEQSGDAKVVDRHTDTYALGCLTYEMLTGEPPFTGTTAQAILAKHMQQPVPQLKVLRPTLPLALQNVIDTALAKVPADRYRTTGEFATALAGAASGRTARQQRRLRVAAVAAAFVIIVPLFILAWRSAPWGRGATQSVSLDPRHIAVLYFDDLSPGRNLGHIANGLTEDLIDELSQVPILHVIAPNGVRPYRSAPAHVDSLAHALRVGTLVAGSVTSTGEQLHVKVRLIDAQSGRQVEAAGLDEPRARLFVLQDTLASKVALLLRERLGEQIRLREGRIGTKSARAWESVKRAQTLATEGAALVRVRDSRALDVLMRADSLLVEAERLDSAWIQPVVNRGWVALSLAFVSPGPDATTGGSRAARASDTSPSALSVDWILRGVGHAEAALRRRPDDPEALQLRGDLRRWLVVANRGGVDTLLPLAEADLRTALSGRPDFARAWYALSYVYYRQARFAEAARAAKRALDEDAFLTEIRSVVSTLFIATLNNEQFADARVWCRKGLDTDRMDPRFADCELTLLGYSGRGSRDVRAAWRLLRDIEQRDSTGVLAATWGYRRLMVTAVLARTGAADSARAVIRRKTLEEANHPTNAPAFAVEAYVQLLLGDADAALAMLRRYLESAPHERAFVARSPWYRALHLDSRFQALVRRVS